VEHLKTAFVVIEFGLTTFAQTTYSHAAFAIFIYLTKKKYINLVS
jgi:hypothetical protein